MSRTDQKFINPKASQRLCADSRIEDIAFQAQQAMRAEDWPTAIECLEEVCTRANEGRRSFWRWVVPANWYRWSAERASIDLCQAYAFLAKAYRECRRLDEAEQVLSAAIGHCRLEGPLINQAAIIAYDRKEWRSAANRFLRLRELGGGISRRNLVRLVRSLRLAGDYDAAEAEATEGARRYPKDPSLAIELALVSLSTGDLAQAAARFEEVHALRGRRAWVRRLPTKAYLKFLEQLGEEQLKLSHLSLFVDSRALKMNQPEPDAGKTCAPVRKVLVAGYYYSGSSAIFDFLGNHESVTTWPKIGELRFINLPWGLEGLLQQVAQDGILTKRGIVELLLHLYGMIPKHVAKKGSNKAFLIRVANKTNKQMLAGPDGSCHERSIIALIRSLIRLADRCLDESDLHEAIRNFFDLHAALLGAYWGSHTVVYDRPVPPQRLHRTVLFRNADVIAVHRDPRDQYVDIVQARLQRKQAELSPGEFITMYRQRRMSAIAHYEALDPGERESIHLLAFEEFISSESTRDWLAGKLGIATSCHRGTRFDIGKSQQNISIHKTFADQSSIQFIEAALPDFLWPTGHLSKSSLAR